MLAVGENGAGKTNLLEALHVGTQGFSPRSRNDAQLVRLGAEAARIELSGDRAGSSLEIEVTLRPGDAKRARLNGAALRAAEQLRSEVSTLVFTPDRLVVVKGGPAARRAYFDRALGRLFPARAGLPAEYGAAVAQRNAALRRVAIGASSRDAVAPWTERVGELGAGLVSRRFSRASRRDPSRAHARALGRLFPARAGLPAEYGAAVAQRNAALRRVAIGASSRDAVAPWTERVGELGAGLVAARREAISMLGPPFGACAAELGLDEAELRYDAEPPTAAALDARFDEDLERGTTGLGPHLDEIEIRAGDRDLRRFGSQGEQRLAVLSLILAEAALLTDRGPAPPLLLLDDVLSELDGSRRAALAERLAGPGQTLITATGASVLPAEPAQLVQVTPGAAR